MNTDKSPRFPTPYTAATIINEAVHSAICAKVVKLQLTPRRNFDGDGFTIAYDAEVVWTRTGPDGKTGWGTHAGTIELRRGGTDPDYWSASIFWGHYDLSKDAAFEDRAKNYRNRLTFVEDDLKPFNWECGHCGNDCSGLCDAPLDARYDA